MINLADYGVIIEIKDRNLTCGQVIKQYNDSIVVNFVDLNSFMPVCRRFAFPDAFEEGTLYIEYCGKANNLFLESINLMKQFRATKVILDGLTPNDDALFYSLDEKQKDITKRLLNIQEAFKIALEEDKKENEIKRCWEFIEEKEIELKRDMPLLATDVKLVKLYKDACDNYSGFKFQREYKRLKLNLERACINASARINSIVTTEEELRNKYGEVGRVYIPKYLSLPKNCKITPDCCDFLFKCFSEFESSFPVGFIGNMMYVAPSEFQLVQEGANFVMYNNEDGVTIKLYKGKNENISRIDNTFFRTKVKSYIIGDEETRYVKGSDFYYEERIYPDEQYSIDIKTGKCNEKNISKIERLVITRHI